MKKFSGCSKQIIAAKKDDNGWLPLVSIKIISAEQYFKKDTSKDAKIPITSHEEYICDEFVTDITGLTVLITNLLDIKKEFEESIVEITPKGEKQ